MNRTNSGANTDTEQLLVDIFILIGAFGLDMLFFRNLLKSETIPDMIVLIVVFTIIIFLPIRLNTFITLQCSTIWIEFMGRF